jgi:hypothetical protein
MIRKLYLQNFRGFLDEHEAHLAPITLVFGQNSSGKSALLQAIALISQSLPRNPLMRRNWSAIPNLFNFVGQNINLAGFRNIVSGHDESRSIGLGIEVLPPSRPVGPWSFSASTLRYGIKVGWNSEQEEMNLESAQFGITQSLGDEHLTSNFEIDNVQGFESLSAFSRGAARVDLSIKASDLAALVRVFKNDVETRSTRASARAAGRMLELGEESNRAQEMVRRLAELPEDVLENYLFDFLVSHDFEISLDGMLVRLDSELRGRDKSEVREFEPEDASEWDLETTALAQLIIDAAMRIQTGIRRELLRTTYLGPMRAAPQRLEDLGSFAAEDLGSDGSGTTARLYRLPDTLTKVNLILEEMEIPYSVQPVRIANDAYPTVGEYLALQLTDSRTGVTVSPRDVGYGISQVLPLVAEAASRGEAPLLVEQPELHLHPRLQALLAEVLVRASNERQIILETHSENILLRLQRLVREGTLPHDRLSILYVGSREQSGSWLQPIRLGSDGEMLDEWPDGFFEERLADY